jgi:hypothetical protein
MTRRQSLVRGRSHQGHVGPRSEIERTTAIDSGDTTMRGRGRWRQGGLIPLPSGVLDHASDRSGPNPRAPPVRATDYAVTVCGQGVAPTAERCGGGFCRRAERRGEQPGRERPHLRTPDPAPRVGHGVAHVPATCLRSCDGLRTLTSPTIESGFDCECTRRFGAIRHDSRPIVSGNDAGDGTVDLASHLSLGCSEIARPSRR